MDYKRGFYTKDYQPKTFTNICNLVFRNVFLQQIFQLKSKQTVFNCLLQQEVYLCIKFQWMLSQLTLCLVSCL